MNSEGYRGTVYGTPLLFWLLLGAVALLVGVAFHDTILQMEQRWSGSEEYGYGYLIPVITAFLIWQRKNSLAQMEFHPSIAGLVLVLLGGALLLLGALATTHTLSQYGLVVTLLGVALALLGRRAFMVVAVPMILLFFMVPLPPFIYNSLSTKLQLISSQLGVAVIRLFDISVYLEGNVIDLGSYKLQVVDACSGLRYLFPLTSLSFIAAYIYRGDFWKRAVIFLSSIPITVFMNSLRIGVIGVLVEYGGPEQAEGFLHYFEGWVIFMACMAILILEMAMLAKVGSNKRTLSEVFAVDIPEPLPADLPREQRRTGGLVAVMVPVLLLLVAGASLYLGSRQNILPERRTFAEFPLQVGAWKGVKGRLEENILDALKTEDYIVADFRNPDNEDVNFYIAYYADQAAGSAAHSPRACIPGGGWLIKELSQIPVEGISINGRPLQVNRLLTKKGGYTQLVYYWFQQRGRSMTSEWEVKWYLFQDAMMRNRTDGALVRFVTLLYPGEEIAEADARLVEFAQAVMPYLEDYIPD